MSHLFTGLDEKIFEGVFIFLDNNFLSKIFTDADLFQRVLKFIPLDLLTVDPFTRFEFSRDIFLPEQVRLRRKFLELFQPAVQQTDLMRKLEDNALILSQICLHRRQKKGEKGAASLVDLFLGARLMLYERSLLITANKKDFPHCVFDTVNVLSYEDRSGNLVPFSVITFNAENFNLALEDLDQAKGMSKCNIAE